MEVPLYLSPAGEPAGYCKLIKTWGSDADIIAAARMSTDGAFRGWGTPEAPGDEKLLRYLWEHQHSSVFEFAGAEFEFQVPVFVLRQIHRHRAASYSEVSARYTSMPEAFWVPRPEDVRRQGGTNRQGSVVDDSVEWAKASEAMVQIMAISYEESRRVYELLLSMGMAREQARAVLPVAQMTRCRMTTTLRMWLHFLSLRLDKHAQPETRAVAEAIAQFVREAFPRTMALFEEKAPK